MNARRLIRYRWTGAQPALLAVLVVAALAPFVEKAFHIDDPVYLWVARKILEDPLDYFGFALNWNGFVLPAVRVQLNPPLQSYYLAAVGALVGFGERAVHVAMWIPALAVVLGVFALAQRLTSRPWLAVSAACCTPLALVSATTVMSDVPMLALWCWTVVLWMDGLRRRSRARLALAALGMGLCPLAKYFGVAIAPLLFAHAWARERRLGAWTLWFLIPAAVLLGYHAHVWLRYGSLPLVAAADYSIFARGVAGDELPGRTVSALSFLGGGLAPLALFAPLLWSRRALVASAGALLALAAAIAGAISLGALPLGAAIATRWSGLAQLALFSAVGAFVISLALSDLRRARDADALLLGGWALGTFAFAAWLNWSTNARAVLPAAPAAALLLVRTLERREAGAALELWRGFALLAPGLALALLVAAADRHLANTQRRAAEELAMRYSDRPGRLWFEGAWGFQWYMEANGARKVDYANSLLLPGEVVIVPAENSGLLPPPAGDVVLLETVEYEPFPLLATMSSKLGAGFYTDVYGPLPYAFGRAPRIRFRVYQVVRPLPFDAEVR